MADEPQQIISVNFTIGVGDGQFTATAIVPTGPTNLTQILPVLQSLDDSFIAGIASQHAEAGRIVSCRAGCGACCRQMVPISIFEAEALAAWIRTLPESRQQELARRFHEALLALSKAGLIDRMVNEDWYAETDSIRQLGIDYLYQRIPCPFLEDESCSIYSIRPLVCREYLVTSPPEHCVDPATLQAEPVRLPLYFSRALYRIGADLENDSRGSIPLLFLFAFMKSGVHPGDSVAGDGPSVLHEFVKRLTGARPPQ